MDIWSVKETFLDRFYERFGTVVDAGWNIIDIGGGIGDFSIFAAMKFPENRVFAFEPTPDSFRLLKENLVLNNINNVQAFPDAIWSESVDISIDASSKEPVQFTSQPINDGSSIADRLVVHGLSLKDAFQNLGIGQCDLMKIDCEGAEFEILFHTSDVLLDKIDRIVMEYHDNVGCHTHFDLEKYLAEKGYSVKITPNFVHPYLGYLYAARQKPDGNR